MSFQSHQAPGSSKRNVYTGFIFFIVLIALMAGLTIFVLNHEGIYSEVIYKEKLKEFEQKLALTVTHTENSITISALKPVNLKIQIDSKSYEFTLTEGENTISFASYQSPEPMLSINNQQNSNQNYLHPTVENSKLELILPSEFSINLHKNSEMIVLGQLISGENKSLLQAEFTLDEAPNEN